MKTKATLTLNLTYSGHDADERTCQEILNDLVRFAANRGLLSGDLDMVVDEYDHTVKTEVLSYEDDEDE